MYSAVRSLALKLSVLLTIPFLILSTPIASATAPWGSLYFDGTQYLYTSNMSAPGTGNFTYELWFYNTTTTAGNQTILNSRQSVGIGQQKDGFDLAITSTRSMYASYKSLAFFNNGDGTIETNRWYHFALVRQGNTTYGYLNGTLIASQALAGDGLNFFSQQQWIGATAGAGNKFNGYIANYRYTKSDLYSANFSTPTDDYDAVANTSILMKTKNDATFITNSISGTTFTNYNGVAASSRNPFENISTQASRDAAAESERKRLEAERTAAIRTARNKLGIALSTNQAITSKDLVDADISLSSVSSLQSAYNELKEMKLLPANAPESTIDLLQLHQKLLKYLLLERIEGVSTGPVYARDLLLSGVIPSDQPFKQLTTHRLMLLSQSERDSATEIENYFAKAKSTYLARKSHVLALSNKIRNR